MSILKSWMLKMSKKKSSKRNKKLDIIAMAVLHLRLCDPEEAQATLASLSKVIYCRDPPLACVLISINLPYVLSFIGW